MMQSTGDIVKPLAASARLTGDLKVRRSYLDRLAIGRQDTRQSCRRHVLDAG